MVVFSILVVVVFQFAWPEIDREQTEALAPGVLWVIYLFAALLGLGRTFTAELENDAHDGPRPRPRHAGLDLRRQGGGDLRS